VHYPVPVHLQPAYRDRLPAVVPLPHTEQAARRVVSLPLHPHLSDDQCRAVCEKILAFVASPEPVQTSTSGSASTGCLPASP
jgi:dTDP-4-amino-4,6-dideoxygalactose transaminase